MKNKDIKPTTNKVCISVMWSNRLNPMGRSGVMDALLNLDEHVYVCERKGNIPVNNIM